MPSRREKDRLEEGWGLLDAGELEGAARTAEELLAEDPDDVEALLLSGTARMDAGDLDGAEDSLRRAREGAPGDPRVALALGHLLFQTCRFEEALEEAGRLLAQEESPQARWLEGLVLDLQGRRKQADASFLRAAALDPVRFGNVPTIPEHGFREAIRDALEELPDVFRQRIHDLPILLRDVPTSEMLLSMDDPSPDLLGLFVGIPLTERSVSDSASMASITLFTRNLERACADGAELVEEIRVTLLHEIGHYLGMTEEDLERAGYD